MSHELLCSWLKLPTKSWPPDHYTLLGLKPGESDTARIERHVQLRMEWVRCYQLAHPDLVTEAMTRLAQAFDCLCNPEARKAYDAQQLGKAAGRKHTQTAAPATPSLAPPPAKPGPPPTPKLAPVLTNSAATETIPPRAEKSTMPMPLPLKAEAPTAAPPADGPAAAPLAPSPPAPEKLLPAPPAVLPSVPVTNEAIDPALEAARSGPARRGLGTKRALYQRISRTRQLIRAWVQAGKYLADPKARLKEKTDAIDLIRQLTIIRQQLTDFPALLGQAGQPGYLVIALARQPEIVKTFQALDPTLRKSYVRDWEAGLAFLAAYRQFLREELWDLRRQGRVGRLLRLTRSVIGDHPGLWLFLLALLAANIAFPTLQQFWPFEIVGAVLLLVLLVFYKNVTRRRSLHRSRRRAGK
jgi:hypothetical protein